MPTYRLTAVNSEGHGETYGGWGDTYEVEAAGYIAARENVLGRVGTDGSRPYAKIVQGWVKDDRRWVRLPECEDCHGAVAETEWAGSGRVICWDCCDIRQGRA